METLDATNIGAVFQRGMNHPEQRHRLLAFFEDDSDESGVCRRIVSQFAVRQLVEHGQEHAFPVLYNVAYGNPSLKGGSLRLTFSFSIKRLTRKSKGCSQKGYGEDVMLEPHPTVPFDHDGMVHKKGEAEEKGGDEMGSFSTQSSSGSANRLVYQ